MAELVDALDSGSSGSNIVQVQVLLSAPEFEMSPRNRAFLMLVFSRANSHANFYIAFYATFCIILIYGGGIMAVYKRNGNFYIKGNIRKMDV